MEDNWGRFVAYSQVMMFSRLDSWERRLALLAVVEYVVSLSVVSYPHVL
jgi:hypothetical protein